MCKHKNKITDVNTTAIDATFDIWYMTSKKLAVLNFSEPVFQVTVFDGFSLNSTICTTDTQECTPIIQQTQQNNSIDTTKQNNRYARIDSNNTTDTRMHPNNTTDTCGNLEVKTSDSTNLYSTHGRTS